MEMTDRLYVEIVPFEGPHAPVPHPVRDGKFDPSMIYKVIGSYNPSETSECYLTLVNPQRQMWFISNRHVRAYKLIDSDEFFIPKARFDGEPQPPERRRFAGVEGRMRHPGEERDRTRDIASRDGLPVMRQILNDGSSSNPK